MTVAADLHMHSWYSDGFFSPTEVARKACAAGCTVVSLTDHDTLAGVPEMNAAAASMGLVNLPGIEISAFLNVETHILGYNVSLSDPAFGAYVAGLEESRRRRSAKILEKLKTHGIIVPDGYFSGKVRRELSRSHIAQAIADLGYEPDAETAFKKWLRSGAPGFVAMEGRPPREAIERIHAAGGKAVLAHPVRLELDGYGRRAFIKLLASYGLDGIEAVYKRSSSETVRRFRNIGDGLGLFATCGADYHSDRNEIVPRRLSARTVAELQIPGRPE